MDCSYVKSAEALFTNAEEAYRNKDEERAYVLYMRYFNVIQHVKKLAEYKKSKVCTFLGYTGWAKNGLFF